MVALALHPAEPVRAGDRVRPLRVGAGAFGRSRARRGSGAAGWRVAIVDTPIPCAQGIG